jgi:L-serine/L-threonine ammonia-lyase
MKASRFKIAMTLLLLSIYLLILLVMLLLSQPTLALFIPSFNNKVFTKTTSTVQSGRRQRQYHRIMASASTYSSATTTTSTTTNANANLAQGASQLYSKTPLLYSTPLSRLVGRDVYLKLDALQASGSFKDRGMAHLCATFRQEDDDGTGTTTELVSSSGGNAGLAVATVARSLNMTVQVIVPTTTKPIVIAKLQALGAHVTVHGVNWNEADALARKWVDEQQQQQPTSSSSSSSDGNTTVLSPRRRYVSPYDHPLLWTGHSTIVDEIVHDLPSGVTISAMILSVGGGGLLCGILEGCARHSSASAARTDTTKIFACETQGASSFGQAWQQGHVVTLPGIDSIATSLGATSVTPVALERARAHPGGVVSAICTDAEAIDACVKFAQDHRLLVEPACGAALAVLYSDRLRNLYLKEDIIVPDGVIVVEVCGGSGVNVDLLYQWKQQYLTNHQQQT